MEEARLSVGQQKDSVAQDKKAVFRRKKPLLHGGLKVAAYSFLELRCLETVSLNPLLQRELRAKVTIIRTGIVARPLDLVSVASRGRGCSLPSSDNARVNPALLTLPLPQAVKGIVLELSATMQSAPD